MQENNVLALLFIVLLAATYLQWIEAAFFHELGHLKKARRYKYCKAEITLKYAVPLFKVKDCDIKRNKNQPCEGFTSLDNNYLAYTDEELREIAKAGVSSANDFIFSVGIISLIVMFGLRYTIQGASEYFTRADYMMIISFAMTVFCALANRWKYTRDSEWGDKEIAMDPAGYKDYIRKVIEDEQSSDS